MTPYYKSGGITIYHGNANEVLRSQDCEERFDEEMAIVTDPPYGVGKHYGDDFKDDMTAFVESVRLVANMRMPAALFLPVSRIMDLPVRPQWFGVWNKTWGASALIAYPFFPHWDAIAFYGIKGDYAGNNGHRSDVFTFAPIRAETGGHPTPKPLALVNELVRFMRAGTILDPFMGSGTTLRAAKDLGRRAIGIEIEERYCEIAARRLDQEVLAL